MNNFQTPVPSPNKKIIFNSRYDQSLAFKDAFIVIKACGLLSFYNVLCDTIIRYATGNDLMHTKRISDDLSYLTPKPTNVSDTVLSHASQILEATMNSIRLQGYNPDTEFEAYSYHQQVFFCLTEALSFLTTVQRFECSIAEVEAHSIKIVEQYQREVSLQEAQAQAKRGYSKKANTQSKRSL